MNTIIVLNHERVTISTADEARELRDTLLARVATCPLVTDTASHEVATNLLRDLRNFYKAIEVGRETAKAPVIRMGKEIDAFARELSFAVEEHGKRVGSLLGAWDMEQKRLAEVKRQEAAAEEARIRREAAEAERAEQERQEKLAEQARREVARQQAEIDRAAAEKAARARTEAGRERAAEEARKAKEALEAKAAQEAKEREEKAIAAERLRSEQEIRRVGETRQNALASLPVKPKDTSTRRKPCFEITDIVALYEAAPFLVNMTPNTAALNSAINGLRGEQTLPGVKHWFESSTITRG